MEAAGFTVISKANGKPAGQPRSQIIDLTRRKTPRKGKWRAAMIPLPPLLPFFPLLLPFCFVCLAQGEAYFNILRYKPQLA